MPLSDARWGYCRHCNREVEVQWGRLIGHPAFGRIACDGSGQTPTEAPPEGQWREPRQSAAPEYRTAYAARPAARTGLLRRLKGRLGV